MIKYVLGYNPISAKIITIKLNTRPCTILSNTGLCSHLRIIGGGYQWLLWVVRRNSEHYIPGREIMILGGWNAKVGNMIADHIGNTICKYGLGKRYDHCVRLINFCIDRKLSIMNIHFMHHPRRFCTWRSPGDRDRNQIDYVMLDFHARDRQ